MLTMVHSIAFSACILDTSRHGFGLCGCRNSSPLFLVQRASLLLLYCNRLLRSIRNLSIIRSELIFTNAAIFSVRPPQPRLPLSLPLLWLRRQSHPSKRIRVVRRTTARSMRRQQRAVPLLTNSDLPPTPYDIISAAAVFTLRCLLFNNTNRPTSSSDARPPTLLLMKGRRQMYELLYLLFAHLI